MKKIEQSSAHQILTRVQQEGLLVVEGIRSLQAVRDAIHEMVAAAELEVVFDPNSAPEIVDYLVVVAPCAAEYSIWGALIGVAVGAIFEEPLLGAALGGGTGALVGAAQGVKRIRHGWRVRAYWTPERQPALLIRPARR